MGFDQYVYIFYVLLIPNLWEIPPLPARSGKHNVNPANAEPLTRIRMYMYIYIGA